MKELANGWVKYWEDRTKNSGDYYGKSGRNSNGLIEILGIKRKDVVLDIGCANGAHLTDITNKTGAKCFGIDISPIAVKLNKDKRLKLNVADMEKTGYPKNKFTKVFTLGVFEHTPRSLGVFKELNRIMKIGGLAYVSVPNKLSLFHITKNIKMRLGTWDLGYEKSFTIWELRKISEKAGFKLEKVWLAPHGQISNIFNLIDNLLNKLNSRYFGFFN